MYEEEREQGIDPEELNEIKEDPESFTLSVTTPDEVATIVDKPIITPHEDRPQYELRRPVFFVGFMVAGKTSVSRKLARSCGIASVDLDAYIERREGKAINQIFAEIGEEGFREMETSVLDEFAHGEPLLVSCGGGIVLRPENRKIIKENGCAVYLQVTAEEAAARIGDVSTRPNFHDLETARKTIADRLPMYEETADCSVDTVGKSISEVAREVGEVLEKEGILCQLQK